LRLFRTYKNSSDEELMQNIQNNDYVAFEELHKRYSKRLLHFMYKMLNNDDERAQDLLQDLFLKIVERPEMFDTNKKFYSWVFTVAANLCRNEYRKPNFIDISTDEYETSEFSKSIDGLIAQFDAKVFSKHLGKALDHLEHEQKETFVLRFQEGFSLKEIAEIMECSLGTVKSRVYYSTKKLAKELEEFRPLLKKM
tara:strand:- start:1135 stop:1722 length:588 start_codon:yes stop_codon:yes gene_type:complete